MNLNQIDITFDFREDVPSGKDPDLYSPKLRNYHKLLWSKPLPLLSKNFELDDSKPKKYLYHRSDLGEFSLSSDSMVPSFSRSKKISNIINKIPTSEINDFLRLGYTMGGMIIFPSNRINGKITLNGAKGFNKKISDRFDLTLECIRRHYLGVESPLSDVINRYSDYFKIFSNFKGYVEFFLLQDAVTNDFSGVRMFLPFDDFKNSPLPESVEAYLAYKEKASEFINLRNHRIVSYCNEVATSYLNQGNESLLLKKIGS